MIGLYVYIEQQGPRTGKIIGVVRHPAVNDLKPSDQDTNKRPSKSPRKKH